MEDERPMLEDKLAGIRATLQRLGNSLNEEV